MICRKDKFIFIHVPKTAGTSIENALICQDCSLVANQVERGIPLNHLTIREAIQYGHITLKELKSYFVFSFVRNPWDRVVSDIFYFQFVPEFQNKTFPSKVKTYCNISNTSVYGNHLNPQVDFFEGYWQYVDFIGTFERLHQDFSHVTKILGKPSIKLAHLNSSNHPHYSKLLTPELIELIRNKYRQDIKKFDYKYLSSDF